MAVPQRIDDHVSSSDSDGEGSETEHTKARSTPRLDLEAVGTSQVTDTSSQLSQCVLQFSTAVYFCGCSPVLVLFQPTHWA